MFCYKGAIGCYTTRFVWGAAPENNNEFYIVNPGLLFLRGPLKGGSRGESKQPSFVKEFVTQADTVIDSQNLPPAPPSPAPRADPSADWRRWGKLL